MSHPAPIVDLDNVLEEDEEEETVPAPGELDDDFDEESTDLETEAE